MLNSQIQSIYLEQFIPNESPETVWNKFINSKEFQSLFDELQFDADMSKEIIWKELFFLKQEGNFVVESIREYMHILFRLQIKNNVSSLLFTLDSQNDGVLLRIDHRGFKGKGFIYRIFLHRWKKLLKYLAPPKQKK